MKFSFLEIHAIKLKITVFWKVLNLFPMKAFQMELDWQEDASNRHYENWRGQDFKDSISTRKSKSNLHAKIFRNFRIFLKNLTRFSTFKNSLLAAEKLRKNFQRGCFEPKMNSKNIRLRFGMRFSRNSKTKFQNLLLGYLPLEIKILTYD